MGGNSRYGAELYELIVGNYDHSGPSEEVPQKIRSKVTQYLSSCKDKDKWKFEEIRREFVRIKQHKDRESLKQFSTAFAVLFSYAMNLLIWPWKTEFKTIKTYGGYYNIYIKSVLKDPVSVFNLMGYTERDGVLKLERPAVNKEVILDVAVGLLIAHCELNLVRDVYATLRQEYSIGEILECRQLRVGSVKECVDWLRKDVSREPTASGYRENVTRRRFADEHGVVDSHVGHVCCKTTEIDRGPSKESTMSSKGYFSGSAITSRSSTNSKISVDRADCIKDLTQELPLEPMSFHDSGMWNRSPKPVVNLEYIDDEDLYQPASLDKHLEQSLHVLERESSGMENMDVDDQGSFQDWSIVYDTLGKEYFIGDRGDITAQATTPQVTTIKTKPLKVFRMRELPHEVVVDGTISVKVAKT